MNLILALILAIIIMLCMFLIQNKLVALTMVLIIIIMLILARPGDFTLNHSYIVTYEENKAEQNESASVANGEEQENSGEDILPGVPTPGEDILPGVPTPSFISSGSVSSLSSVFERKLSESMNIINQTHSRAAPAEQFAEYLGLSENNMEHIGEQLEGIDWGNLLKKSLDSLKAYSEGSGVNGTNNSKLNANAAGVESGS